MQKFSKHFSAYFLLVLAGIAVLIWFAVFDLEARRLLTVTFFDVGQGDAIFVQAPGGGQMLVDGGPSDRVLARLGRAMPFWDRSIDLVVLTHPDRDHVAGLLDVLRRYEVCAILWSGVEHTSAEYREWLQLIEHEGAQVVLTRAGQRVRLGKHAIFDVLAPFIDRNGNLIGATNDTSVVGLLRYGATEVLLTGDISRSVEYRLLFEAGAYLDADVLKVGHHGSKTSSSEEFLRAVSPDTAVIQVGRKNRYGHPDGTVLERLASVGATIMRTDVDGDIRMRSDGMRYWFD